MCKVDIGGGGGRGGEGFPLIDLLEGWRRRSAGMEGTGGTGERMLPEC